VNLFGTYRVTQAFLPQLTRSRGAIVNNVSLMALAPLPITPAYAISKAAAFSLTQSLRALLAARGVRVHAVLTGPTDTDMTPAAGNLELAGQRRGRWRAWWRLPGRSGPSGARSGPATLSLTGPDDRPFARMRRFGPPGVARLGLVI